MRVLEFIPGFYWHGITERVLACSQNLLDGAGEAHWISLEPGRPNWLGEDRIQLHHVIGNPHTEPTEPFAGLGTWDTWPTYQAARELARLIHQLNPDQLNCWSAQTAWIATLARHWFSNPEIKRTQLIYHESYLSPLRKSIPVWQRRLMDRHLEAIEVSHPSICEELRAEGFRQPITLAPAPIVVNEFPIQHGDGERTAILPSRQQCRRRLRSQLDLGENTFVAGAVAPLVPRTRLKDLIWATDLLNVFLDNFHLVIWGTGTQYRDLKRFAAQTAAADQIHFLQQGRAGEQELAGLDCFWQAHLLEPGSSTMLKAMAIGVPIIAVAGQGTDEWIRHQQTGFSVNFGARDEFARWTTFIMEQVAAADQMTRQAKRWLGLNANTRLGRIKRMAEP